MKLRKTTFGALLCVLCLSAFLASALAADQRIFDEADLLSSSEEESISLAIARFQETTGMDFVLLTSSESHEGVSSEAVADDFYDQGGFGFDADHSGVLYYIDMYDRNQHLSTTGSMIDYMTDERIDDVIEACTPSLSQGRYEAAVSRMIAKLEGYIKSGIPEGQFRYDVITGERLTSRHKALTQVELLVSAAIAVVVGLLCTIIVKHRYQLKGSTYRYQYRSNCNLNMADTDDTYLRTTTTRTLKPKPPATGGSGGGGFSGGSGTHVGSSGTSHGGGGGRF